MTKSKSVRRNALSDDTSAEAQQFQLQLWRRLSESERLDAVSAISTAVNELALSGIRQRHPGASDRECFLRLAVIRLGPDVARRLYADAEAVLGASP